MACPECGSKKVVNENTGRDPMSKLYGGTFHNTCKNCGCEWTHCCATGSNITRHGKFFKKKKKPESRFEREIRRRKKGPEFKLEKDVRRILKRKEKS